MFEDWDEGWGVVLCGEEVVVAIVGGGFCFEEEDGCWGHCRRHCGGLFWGVEVGVKVRVRMRIGGGIDMMLPSAGSSGELGF